MAAQPHSSQHTHPPPPNSKAKPNVKEKVLDQLSVGAKPSVIHTKLLTEAKQPISPKDVSSKQTIYNWQHQMTMSQLPTDTTLLFFATN